MSRAHLVSFSSAVGLAVLMPIAGSLVPPLRATRVDPLEVIRTE